MTELRTRRKRPLQNQQVTKREMPPLKRPRPAHEAREVRRVAHGAARAAATAQDIEAHVQSCVGRPHAEKTKAPARADEEAASGEQRPVEAEAQGRGALERTFGGHREYSKGVA